MRAKLFAEENRKWWTLVAVSFGLFMIMLDNTIVNVALPTIQRDLGLKVSELEWIVTGYALTFGAFMLTGGKLADLFGRRRIFVVGLVVFTAASLACGLADGATMLIGARVVQGLGAAMMNPATLSIITVTFPRASAAPRSGSGRASRRSRSRSARSSAGSSPSGSTGTGSSSSTCPVGALAIAAAYAFITESRDTSHEQRPDVPGLVTSAVGLFALSYGLIEANSYGWTSARILVSFAIAAVFLGSFVLLELHQRLPMLDLSLFKNRTFSGANTVMLLVGPRDVRRHLLRLALRAEHPRLLADPGRCRVPALDAPDRRARAAGGQARRPRRAALARDRRDDALRGARSSSSRATAPDATFWDLLPAMLLGGVGLSAAMAPVTATAMGSVPRDKAGVGSAVLNSMRQVGGSLGVAIMGAIVARSVTVPGAPTPDEFVTGYHHALEVASVIVLAGALIAALTLRKVHHPEPAQAQAPAPAGAVEAA